jgi:hypothetical protein
MQAAPHTPTLLITHSITGPAVGAVTPCRMLKTPPGMVPVTKWAKLHSLQIIMMCMRPVAHGAIMSCGIGPIICRPLGNGTHLRQHIDEVFHMLAYVSAFAVQLVAAFVRPHPQVALRGVWNAVHHNLGRVVILVAWATMWLGVAIGYEDLPGSSLARWLAPIAGGCYKQGLWHMPAGPLFSRHTSHVAAAAAR